MCHLIFHVVPLSEYKSKTCNGIDQNNAKLNSHDTNLGKWECVYTECEVLEIG